MQASASDNRQPIAYDSLLRLPAVLARVGMSKTAVYQLAKEGRFPAVIKLGPRTSAWKASDIAQWIARQG